MIKNKKLVITLFVYYVLFYTIWSLFGMVFNQMTAATENDVIFIQLIRSGIIKNLVWTLPALVLVKHFETDMYVGLKEMFTNKIKWLQVLPIFLLCIVCVVISAWKRSGLSIVDTFGWSQIIIVLFVGITEESVFRGWLLNSTLKKADKEWKQWVAIGVNALLFLMIHFPIWIYDGVFITNFQTFAFIDIILLSIVFSWLFMTTKNILVPISLHMLYDLLVFMLIG